MPWLAAGCIGPALFAEARASMQAMLPYYHPTTCLVVDDDTQVVFGQFAVDVPVRQRFLWANVSAGEWFRDHVSIQSEATGGADAVGEPACRPDPSESPSRA